MPRAKPLTKACVVCSEEFLTVRPRIKVCGKCTAMGLREGQTRQASEKSDASKSLTKTCSVCSVEFQTTRKNATRCSCCVASNRAARRKACITCGVKFPAPNGDEYQCPSCAEELGIGQSELTSEQLEALWAEETLARWKNKVAILEADLDERSNAKPKGIKLMNEKTKASAVGVAWLELCARDGQVSALSQIHERDLDDDTKLRLVLAYSRIRLRGYSVEAISKLCPVHLMSLDEGKAIDGLPFVENPNPPTPQQLAEIELGLA